ADGHAKVIPVALDNPNVTESQILRVLSREKLPVALIPAISQHRKWAVIYTVRLALVRHPLSPLATILAYLPEITVSDLRELAAPGLVPERLQKSVKAEAPRRASFPRAFENICKPKCSAACAPAEEGRSRMLPRRTLLRPSQNKRRLF